MLKKPIILTLILSGIPAIFIILFAILQTFTGIKIPFIAFIVDVACLLLVSWLYLEKYNEPVSKGLRLKTAIYCTILSMILLSIMPIVSLIVKQSNTTLFLFLIIMFLGTVFRFVYIYFGLAVANKFLLNIRNYDNNKKPISISDLDPDEKIIYRCEKYSMSSFINELLALGLLFVILRFQAPYLWKMGLDGKIFLIVGVFYCIIMQIDRCFVSDFLVTNKRIIFKRIHYWCKNKDILLDEIDSIKSKKNLFNSGIITIFSKKGFSLRSNLILKPDEFRENIEKYLEEIKKPIPDILD